MGREVTFTVAGKPQAKERHSGYGKFAWTKKKTQDYENSVASWAMVAMRRHGDLLSGPLFVRISCFLEIPASWPKMKRLDAARGIVLPTSVPDVDNLVKSIMDGCKGVVWKDDSFVTDAIVTKRLARRAMAKVTVREIDGKIAASEWTAAKSKLINAQLAA